MRCNYCGSNLIHPEVSHKNFSTGKAIAGAAVLGIYGAAAGFIGKDTKGYRCGACQAFSEKPMDYILSSGIDDAIRDAQKGNFSRYDFYKKQFPSIENVERSSITTASYSSTSDSTKSTFAIAEEETETKIKRSVRYKKVIFEAPLYINGYEIITKESMDYLVINAVNCNETSLRSVYFKIDLYDDTKDFIKSIDYSYNELETECGLSLPTDLIPLNSNIVHYVDIVITKASFVDESVWRNTDYPVVDVELSETIDTYPRLKYFRMNLLNKYGISNPDLYFPEDKGTYWNCICGKSIKSGNKCSTCLCSYEEIIEMMQQKNLEETQKSIIYNRAVQYAEQTSSLYAEAVEYTYNEAVKLSIANPDKAAEMFIDIADYKDSAELFEKYNTKALNQKYNKAISMKKSRVLEKVMSAKESFIELGNYKDAQKLALECDKDIENCKLEATYQGALDKIRTDKVETIQLGINTLKTISDYSDAKSKIAEAESKINQLNKAAYRQKNAAVGMNFGILFLAILNFYGVGILGIFNKYNYSYSGLSHSKRLIGTASLFDESFGAFAAVTVVFLIICIITAFKGKDKAPLTWSIVHAIYSLFWISLEIVADGNQLNGKFVLLLIFMGGLILLSTIRKNWLSNN